MREISSALVPGRGRGKVLTFPRAQSVELDIACATKNVGESSVYCYVFANFSPLCSINPMFCPFPVCPNSTQPPLRFECVCARRELAISTDEWAATILSHSISVCPRGEKDRRSAVAPRLSDSCSSCNNGCDTNVITPVSVRFTVPAAPPRAWRHAPTLAHLWTGLWEGRDAGP